MTVPLRRYGFRLVVLLLASYGTLYHAYKYYTPEFGGADYYQYYEMYEEPFGHDAGAPFAYRILSAVGTNALHELGARYPNEIAFDPPEYDPSVFFSALLFNYLCLLGTALITGRLAEELYGRRSDGVALLAGLVLIASFHVSQNVVTGLTEGMAWLLMAAAFAAYVRGKTVALLAVLALSVVQRETIPVVMGAVATVDLLLRRHPRRFNAIALAGSVAAFGLYVAMRKVIYPRPGFEDQLSFRSLAEGGLSFLQLGFLNPDFFLMGVVSLNVIALVALLALRRWREAMDGFLPHILAASAVVFVLGYASSVGSNVGRLIGVTTPVWAAYAAWFVMRDAPRTPAPVPEPALPTPPADTPA